MAFSDHVHVRSLWKTVGLLLAVFLLASPDAPVPLLFLYGVVIVVALLLPVRHVGRTAVLRTIGGMSLLVGAWVALGTDLTLAYALGFVLLAAVAFAIPRFYPDQHANAQ